MAHGLKYQGTFNDLAGKVVTVQILEKGYGGSSSPIQLSADGAMVETGRRGDNTLENNIRFSTAKINIFDKAGTLFSEFYTTDPTKWRVNVLYDSSLDYIGYIETEQYLRVLDRRRSGITMNVTDPLKILEDVTYNPDTNLSAYIDFVEFLQLLLQLTGLTLQLETATSWRTFFGSQTETDDPLKGFQVPRYRFLGYSVIDILEQLCDDRNCELYQQDGRWRFFNPTHASIDYRFWRYNPNGTLDSTAINTSNVKRIDDGIDEHRIRLSRGEEMPVPRLTDSYQNYVNQHNPGLYTNSRFSILKDNQFFSWNDAGNDLSAWENIDNNLAISPVGQTSGFDRGLTIPGSHSSTDFGIRQRIRLDPAAISEPCQILIYSTFSRGSGTALRTGKLRVKWGKYYLNGFVKLTPTTDTGGILGLTGYRDSGGNAVFAANDWVEDSSARVSLEEFDDEQVTYIWRLWIFPSDIPEDVGDEFEITIFQFDSFGAHAGDNHYIHVFDFQIIMLDNAGGETNILTHWRRDVDVKKHEKIKNVLISEYADGNLIKNMPDAHVGGVKARGTGLIKRGIYGVSESPTSNTVADVAAYERVLIRNQIQIKHNVSYIYRLSVGHKLKYGNIVRIDNRYFKINYLVNEYKRTGIKVEHVGIGETTTGLFADFNLVGRLPRDSGGARIPQGGTVVGGTTPGLTPGTGGLVLRRGTITVATAAVDVEETFAALDDNTYMVIYKSGGVGVDVKDKTSSSFKVNASAPCEVEYIIL